MRTPHFEARLPTVIALLASVVVASSPTPSSAAGFEIPGNGAKSIARGGAFAVRADDLSAIAHNPAGIGRGKGLELYYGHQVVHQAMTFTRGKSVVARSDLYGSDPFAAVENAEPLFALGGMAVAAFDLGLKDVRFALGVYGPSASGKQSWPVSGGQRYMLTSIEMLLVYYSAAIAYSPKDASGNANWGVGATLQYAQLPLTKMAMVIDGSPGGDLNPYYSANDVEARIELADNVAYSAIVGGWLKVGDNLEIAASGRVIPVQLNTTGDTKLVNIPGQTQFPADKLEIENGSARMSLTIPPTATVGARYVHRKEGKEVFDVELNVVYEAWSMLKEYKVELDGKIKLFAEEEAPDVVIAKNWRDTLSARLGGTYRLSDMVGLSLGGYYEQGAVPLAYTHVDFPSFDRVGLGGGVHVKAGKFDVSLAYNHVMQGDRVVDEKYAKVFQVRPLSDPPDECNGPCDPVPANTGTLKTAINLLAVSVTARF
jgi:long-subunit fatty acid transport protein